MRTVGHREAEAAPKGIVVLSKRDIAEPDAEITTAPPVVSLSSVTGDGMDELERVIAEQFLLPEVPAGGYSRTSVRRTR